MYIYASICLYTHTHTYIDMYIHVFIHLYINNVNKPIIPYSTPPCSYRCGTGTAHGDATGGRYGEIGLQQLLRLRPARTHL